MINLLYYSFIFLLPEINYRLILSLKPSEVIFIVLFYAFLLGYLIKERERIYIPKFLLFFAIFIVFCFISFLNAPSIPEVMKHANWASGLDSPGLLSLVSLIRIIILFCFVLFIVNFVRQKEIFLKGVRVYLYGGFVIAVISIVQAIQQIFISGAFFSLAARSMNLINESPFDRPTGLMSEPGPLGEYLTSVFFIALAYYLYNQKKQKSWLIICVLSAIGILLTFSTRSWVGIIFGVALFIAFLWKRVNFKKFVISGLIVSLLLISAITITYEKFPLFDRLGSLVFLKIVNNSPDRVWKRNAAIDLAKDYPWTGVGIGNYPYFHGDYLPSVAYGVESMNFTRGKMNTVADYHQLLAETGILGFASFMLMIVYLIGLVFKNLRIFDHTEEKVLLAGLAVAVFSLLLQFYGSYGLWGAIYIWVLIGWVLAFSRTFGQERAT